MNTFAVKMYDAILNGEFKTGEPLPDIHSLAGRFEGDEQNIAEGIGDLVYEGALERVPGRSDQVRVRAPYLWDLVTGNHSFTGEAKRRGQKPGNRILTFEKRPAWPQVAKRLQLELGDEVNVMERLLLADGQVVGLEFSYMPSKFYPGVEREMFEGGKSTFAVMEKFGHISAKGVDELAVATLEPREAALFGMEPGVPVLIRFRVTLNPEGVPIKGSRAIYLFNPGYSLDI
ncbi:GntR family transcriptional regulator [Pseudoflavonifractor phocaeensis]|uniref:GntR family transcriptional regulator n=1 Tax=Pseudoflavonifractor phocaeensis TaxID=1870988 RepID=UPI0012BB83C5|nr:MULTISPECIES: GntR family transcriptional regulator [Pseudoflavonifractor]MTQ95822.1 UTRA domain-containing protein [Pseudoflavonifractor sp. BIOML-A16]MTR04574.1 UTRA domain-containing protein [Pseudoflavonifractor sp. BIOML-A15]MTR31178.1 UTRA domain-containing protein [Pseudoflavonifractor sp. BIOML-A14]MTR71743.1 UTRA domain-containing protein [Pseudoflavonifractor sp. BIOML-A18]MTS62714.1 UTRA domain-containing protein [Pseudoflavonifractor sp. BIOML-A5]MTS71692.1 UTRA domain-containi